MAGSGTSHRHTDQNRFQALGAVEQIVPVDPLADKWRSFRWSVIEIDGHDMKQVVDALEHPPEPGRPTVIIAHTVAGKGGSFMEDRFEWHLGYLAPEDQARALAELEGTR